MADSQIIRPPSSRTCIAIDVYLKFSNGVPQNSDQDTKRKFFRYTYALYFEKTSLLRDELGE